MHLASWERNVGVANVYKTHWGPGLIWDDKEFCIAQVWVECLAEQDSCLYAKVSAGSFQAQWRWNNLYSAGAESH